MNELIKERKGMEDKEMYEEVKKNITNTEKFASELMVSHDTEYEKRIGIFKKYVIEEIKCNATSKKEEVVKVIRKLIIILFLPVHTKTIQVNKNNIRITLYCNHSGKTKETCKGRDCKYKAILLLEFDKENNISEIGQHCHPMDYSFVVSTTRFLLKSERLLIPQTKLKMIEFNEKHPDVVFRNPLRLEKMKEEKKRRKRVKREVETRNEGRMEEML